MNVSFSGRSLELAGTTVELPWPILAVMQFEERAIVLLDPDSYLTDATYKAARRAGAPAIRNLIAVSADGTVLWEAELPESADYYYEIASVSPLEAKSFSSYRCAIDPKTGRILRKLCCK